MEQIDKFTKEELWDVIMQQLQIHIATIEETQEVMDDEKRPPEQRRMAGMVFCYTSDAFLLLRKIVPVDMQGMFDDVQKRKDYHARQTGRVNNETIN